MPCSLAATRTNVPRPSSSSSVPRPPLQPGGHAHTRATTPFLPLCPARLCSLAATRTNVTMAKYKTRNVGTKEMMPYADVTAQLGHTRVDLLKVDIEGWEFDVVSGVCARMRERAHARARAPRLEQRRYGGAACAAWMDGWMGAVGCWARQGRLAGHGAGHGGKGRKDSRAGSERKPAS